MTTITATVRNRRIDVPAPSDLPDGTEVTLTIGPRAAADDEPLTPPEVVRPQRGLTDVIREIAAEQRARGFPGRSAEDLLAEDEVRLAEDAARDRELDAARLQREGRECCTTWTPSWLSIWIYPNRHPVPPTEGVAMNPSPSQQLVAEAKNRPSS